MNSASSSRIYTLWLLALTLSFLVTGCASQKIDWAPRIGNYTFDQAVLELGPPDKQARLQDGTTVAEWLTRQGYAYAYPGFGYGYYPYSFGGPIAPAYMESPNYYLRLIFGPDGKLKASK